MTVLGYPSTVPVTVEEMLMLAAAARRGCATPLLVGDLPFGSYEASDEQAVRTAQRFVKEAGCDAVKLEGGGPAQADRARAIVGAGIPVMGHVGLTPQTATALGGYRAQGRTADRALGVAREAFALERGRVLCHRLRGDPRRRGRRADRPHRRAGDRDRCRARRPTARCSSSTTSWASTTATPRASPSATPACASRWSPRSPSTPTRSAAGRFPAAEHTYSIDPDELERFRAGAPANAPRAADLAPRARVGRLTSSGT